MTLARVTVDRDAARAEIVRLHVDADARSQLRRLIEEVAAVRAQLQSSEEISSNRLLRERQTNSRLRENFDLLAADHAAECAGHNQCREREAEHVRTAVAMQAALDRALTSEATLRWSNDRQSTELRRYRANTSRYVAHLRALLTRATTPTLRARIVQRLRALRARRHSLWQ